MKHFERIIAVLSVVGLVLVGCATAKEVAQPDTGQPRHGGILTYVETKDMPSSLAWDPHKAVSLTNGVIWNLIGNGLLKPHPETLEILPDLAEKWEQPDDKTLILHLREGVKFHNVPPVNGREFTAEDVVYNFNRITTKEASFPRRSNFEAVEKVEAVDKHTVKISTKEPYAPLLNYLANPYNMMVAKEAVDKWGDLQPAESAIGTGPFIYKESVPASGGSIVKNPNYFIKDRPYLDEVRFVCMTDPAARLAAFRTNQVDVIGFAQGFSKLEAEELKKTNPDVTMAPLPMLMSQFIGINTKNKPFDDERVRKAIYLALDRQEMLDAVLQGGGEIAGPIPPRVFGAFTKAELEKMPGYRQPKDADIAEAKKLLAEAGCAQGLKTTMELCANLPYLNQKPGEVAQAQLAKLGIDIDLKIYETGRFFAMEREKSENMRPRGHAAFHEADDHLYTNLHTKGARNYYGYSDKWVDDMIMKQRMTLDPTERKKIIQDIQKYAMEHAWRPWLFVNHNYFANQPWVQNYTHSIVAAYHQVSDVWVTPH
ncbi:MAG: ABC transporter substrate-binding protein [Chloroflexota bacterium]